MINQLLKGLVDLIYGTQRTRRKFERDHPGETVLAADACKGIITENSQSIERGFDWVTSQRAILMLTDKRIVCGKWTIPLDTVSAVQLFKITTMFGAGYVLNVQTIDDINYQFGMQVNPEWTDQERLSLIAEKAKLKHSFFSIALRLVLFGYVIYWFYERFYVG